MSEELTVKTLQVFTALLIARWMRAQQLQMLPMLTRTLYSMVAYTPHSNGEWLMAVHVRCACCMLTSGYQQHI